jgi:hypothetical protein
MHALALDKHPLRGALAVAGIVVLYDSESLRIQRWPVRGFFGADEAVLALAGDDDLGVVFGRLPMLHLACRDACPATRASGQIN